jgi:hypothetical protein
MCLYIYRRVNGPLSQTPAFAEAFSCPVNAGEWVGGWMRVWVCACVRVLVGVCLYLWLCLCLWLSLVSVPVSVSVSVSV